MLISFFLLFLIGSLVLVYLVAQKKVRLQKNVNLSKPKNLYQGEKDGRIKAKDGMIFEFSVRGKKEEGCKNVSKGAKRTEIKDYGVFSLSVTLKRIENLSVYEISHTHIVPQCVQCYLKRKSPISIYKNGYIECVEGAKTGFILLGAKSVKVENRSLSFFVQDKAYIASKEGDVPTLNSVKEFLSATKNPFQIKTPDQKLNLFFNDWLWDVILKEKKKNFSHAILLCAIKMITNGESCREFLKNAFFEKVEEKFKWCLLIMLCESEKIFDKSILHEKVDNYALIERIKSFIYSDSSEEVGRDTSLLKLYALLEFSANLTEAKEKIKILNIVESESQRLNIQREEILTQKDKYLYTCFKSENALAQKLSKTPIKGYPSVIEEFNPLNYNPIPNFETASLCYIAIVKNLYGTKRQGVGFTFFPEFPLEWQSAKIKYKNEGKTVNVELYRGEQNLLVVDGVKYGGYSAEFFPKREGKYKLIFKE